MGLRKGHGRCGKSSEQEVLWLTLDPDSISVLNSLKLFYHFYCQTNVDAIRNTKWLCQDGEHTHRF